MTASFTGTSFGMFYPPLPHICSQKCLGVEDVLEALPGYAGRSVLR